MWWSTVDTGRWFITPPVLVIHLLKYQTGALSLWISHGPWTISDQQHPLSAINQYLDLPIFVSLSLKTSALDLYVNKPTIWGVPYGLRSHQPAISVGYPPPTWFLIEKSPSGYLQDGGRQGLSRSTRNGPTDAMQRFSSERWAMRRDRQVGRRQGNWWWL